MQRPDGEGHTINSILKIKNQILSIMGGGSKGRLFAAFLLHLDKTGNFPNYKKFMGSSAGGLIATFLGVGHNPVNLAAYIRQFDPNDLAKAPHNIDEYILPLRIFWKVVSFLQNEGFRDNQAIRENVFNKIAELGVPGDLTYWELRELVEAQNISIKEVEEKLKQFFVKRQFSEANIEEKLALVRKARPRFADVAVTVTDIKTKKPLLLQADDKRFKDVSLCDGAAAGASFPGVFGSYTLKIHDENGEGEYNLECSDGGIHANDPVLLLNNPERDRTTAFRLRSAPDKNEEPERKPGLFDLMKAILNHSFDPNPHPVLLSFQGTVLIDSMNFNLNELETYSLDAGGAIAARATLAEEKRANPGEEVVRFIIEFNKLLKNKEYEKALAYFSKRDQIPELEKHIAELKTKALTVLNKHSSYDKEYNDLVFHLDDNAAQELYDSFEMVEKQFIPSDQAIEQKLSDGSHNREVAEAKEKEAKKVEFKTTLEQKILHEIARRGNRAYHEAHGAFLKRKQAIEAKEANGAENRAKELQLLRSPAPAEYKPDFRAAGLRQQSESLTYRALPPPIELARTACCLSTPLLDAIVATLAIGLVIISHGSLLGFVLAGSGSLGYYSLFRPSSESDRVHPNFFVANNHPIV